ncbi:DDE superfamily endonuclease [Hirsutella rhossiliensis]|uniref:DDE superfamily endonuclease domain-containing protein n=1 Tax=Hirsutella rhossiliensis TaxID=111463 RepID=A0A9P8N5P3_9HYPO|nr:DDE superfamily endonuclease domain-containing protein [Hirsutella rhossiliensis]KAH0968113.1 DDE superfamily endonuclease domain-containing protein [Hirsutella rhossiliensis]
MLSKNTTAPYKIDQLHLYGICSIEKQFTSGNLATPGRSEIGNTPEDYFQQNARDQEAKLVAWILRQESVGYAPSQSQIRACVTAVLKQQGLDSLVVGSSDPKRKAHLKGPQSRGWTSFIEAITADGRALTPGIIFKGKELQKQWFKQEFRKFADWHYITSPNGWTDNNIAVEWLEEVYLPQTRPSDESEARLIILDGHGSHATNNWMATCFLNNIYCCYLPSHCSHGLQPLDNGVFNAIKAAYRKELDRLASLTDSAPVDKVNFIRAYARAREMGMTQKHIVWLESDRELANLTSEGAAAP